MKVQTLDSAIKNINADNKKKINAEKLKYSAHEKTGIDIENIISYTDQGIGFGWRNSLDKDSVKKIFLSYPISGENYEMKFASNSKNFKTDSPLVVKWQNSDSYYKREFKIEYTSSGTKISISVPVDHFKPHTCFRQRQGKHRGFGRYEMHNDVFIDYFYTQSYSGGYNTLYFLEGVESLKEYENFVITGNFKYENEIN